MTSQLDVRRGSQRPTLLHLPDGVSGAGQEAIDLARECGLFLDDWQQFCLDGLLLERPNHQWAATEGVVEVTRQNGKNVIQEVGELAGLVLFGEKLIAHSAHLFPTATEHFLRMRSHFENCPILEELLDDIYTANGKEAIVLKGGRRLKFFARSRGGGRGFTGDRLVFDEAFSLTAEAMGAMIPALSARSMEIPGPQVWYFSSPAHSDSAALHNLRRRAAAKAPRLAYFGWLNEPGTDRRDRQAWYRVNPGLGIRITEDWIETELDALEDFGDEFDRERLGVPSAEDSGASVFGPGKWNACADEHSTITGDYVIALDVAPDMQFSSFAAAGQRADGLAHIELIERHPGTGWVVAEAKRLADKWHRPITIDPKSPTAGLLADFHQAGVPIVELGPGDTTKACAAIQNSVIEGKLRHPGQQPLDAAVAGAAIRTSGDTWTWARKTAVVDISPLVAVTIALWAATSGKKVDAGYLSLA
jgi:phage terminase large subunit-like protein